jgi:hypothetical protein
VERAALARGLTERSICAGGYRISVATREDDADIRALLRTNSLGGRIRLAMQREPDAFAAQFGLGYGHDFVLARDLRNGASIALCERSVRDAFVGGRCIRLPYLGSLRVDPAYRNRIGLLRHGFAAVRDLLDDPRDAPFSLTAITADNRVARRVLCAGLSGLPAYVPAGEMSTFALRTERTRPDANVERATDRDLPAIAALLKGVYREYAFAPQWRAEDLQHLAASGVLPARNYLVIRRTGGLDACLALWDQSAVKQTLVTGYATWMARARPFFNIVAPLLRSPRLPVPGSCLRQVYLSHLAIRDHQPRDFVALVRSALSMARERGHELAVLGLATHHPFVPELRSRWHPREYRSLLHVVQWSNQWMPDSARQIVHPEIALL